jgi:hypothetical protein
MFGGGSTSLDVLEVYNYDPKNKKYSFLEVSIGDIQEHPLGVYLGKESLYSILRKLNAIIFLLN